MSLADDLLAQFVDLPEDKKNAIKGEILATQTGKLKWHPNAGPQTEAYYSQADCLLYGGEPGGGKSQLILGLAFNEHKRSLIMRRRYGDLERLIEDALKIHGSRDGFSGSPPPRLRINEDQTINFRAAQHIGDEQSTMGQGRDLLGIDEATHFAESQIRFLMGWVRTETQGQRCRTVLATNPPLTSEGAWVNKMFAPWLDPKFHNPAKPGELRWVISGEDDQDIWVAGPLDTRVIGGKEARPTSRTFIPASVEDNPDYARTDYKRQLMALPEQIRRLLMGGFHASFKDADFQVIPTAWIEAAQERWKPDGNKDFAMTAMAFDPAGGGADSAELCWRHGGWYAPLISEKGAATADPSSAFGHIMSKRRDNAPVVVDAGGGYGGPIILRMNDNGIANIGFNAAGASNVLLRGTKIKCANKRAEAWLRFREELDPDQENGSCIALPPDPELKADLASVCYDPDKMEVRGIYQLESKDDIRSRLGRSTGKGDAVVMCLSHGNAAVRRQLNKTSSLPTRANVGHANIKRRR